MSTEDLGTFKKLLVDRLRSMQDAARSVRDTNQ